MADAATEREIARRLLSQRISEARRSGYVAPPASDTDEPSSDWQAAEKRVAGPFTVVFVSGAVLVAVGLAFLAADVLSDDERMLLGVTLAVPTLVMLCSLVVTNGWQRRRFGIEAASRLVHEYVALSDEGAPFPSHGGVALRRAENLLEWVSIGERLHTQKLLRDVFLSLLFVVPVSTLIAFAVVDDGDVFKATAGIVLALLAGTVFAASRQRLRALEGDARQLDYERTLLTDTDGAPMRAEKLFLKQQFELKRYYDETLRQSSLLSYVGVLCIVAGFGVVGIAFYLVTGYSDANNDLEPVTQVVVGVLAVGANILATFVATLVLRMHSGTITALTSFHERLVGTHHVHFANLLVARVSESARDEALRDVAGKIAQVAHAPPGRDEQRPPE